MFGRLIITVAYVAIVAQTKPIMVTFGTKGGPIVPPTPSTTTLNPLAPKNPAPVYEDVDDIAPPVYKAPTPNQYRNLINTFKPKPNLQLGTPLDINYQNVNALSQLQVQQQKADYASQQGLAYNGAQIFAVQEYEYDNARNRQQQLERNTHLQNQQGQGRTPTSAQQFVQQYVPKRQAQQNNQVQTTQAPAQEEKQNVRQQRHQDGDQAVQGTRYTRVYSVSEPQSQQQQQPQTLNYQYNYNQQNQQTQQQIPAFGVAFSSGLRYYVPQYYYYDSRQQEQQQYQQNYHKSQHSYNEVSDNAIYGH